jgi:hypothetical protein
VLGRRRDRLFRLLTIHDQARIYLAHGRRLRVTGTHAHTEQERAVEGDRERQREGERAKGAQCNVIPVRKRQAGWPSLAFPH